MNRSELAAVNGVTADLLDAQGRLVITPHAVTLDGQRNVPADLRPGESLAAFLGRHVPGIESGAWTVSIAGAQVPRRMWAKTFPKHGMLIACRASVGKQVIAIIAVAILAYFTMGAGATLGASMLGVNGLAAVGAAGAAALNAGIFMVGSMLINKVLAPKVPKMEGPAAARTVYSLSNQRNRARPFEPLPTLWGEMRVTPDLASAPYTWFEGDDQYLSTILLGGINVHSAADLSVGDTPITNYSDVSLFHNGLSGMPSVDVPLYSNADTISGAELENDGDWVVRTSSTGTIAMQFDFEGQLYDLSGTGKAKVNSVSLFIETRPVGTTAWLPALTETLTNATTDVLRRTFTVSVALGQHEARVRLGKPTWDDGEGKDACKIGWNILRSIQADATDYSAWGRIGVKIKATGQLSGSLDTLRATYRARPIPLWNGTEWVTATTRENGLSNPGAILLQTLRGVYAGGKLQFGYGMQDAQIDIEGLKAFMLHCTARGYTYDKWITSDMSLGQFCQEVALAGMGEFSWTDGSRPTAVFVSDGQPLSGVVNMANMMKASFEVAYNLSNAADGIEYQFLDRERNWETTTLRVTAPGVTTMLNPARITGEGVTSEAHAAVMARYHLAQSLYQYKTIGYNADIEHLDYRRLSVLSVSHDLTQWGFGGRLVSAQMVDGRVQIDVGEDLPALPTPHVGLRMPGERDYRVWAVDALAVPGRLLTLKGEWPGDTPLPGASSDDPAHDTLWCYDFKATPGYRVRVVSMEAEPDLKGAKVSCVPEGPEFWNYVLNGTYEPAGNQSSLVTAPPIASNLRISRSRVQVGNGWEHELSAVWDVSGNYDHAQVWAAPAGQPLVLVDSNVYGTRLAWRVPSDQTWSVEVRPFDSLGRMGTKVATVYTDPSEIVGAVTGLIAAVEGTGVALRWAVPQNLDAIGWAGTQIRMGQAGASWETAAPVFEGKTDSCNLGWLAAGTHLIYAAHRNTAGDWSAPVSTSIAIAAPIQPVVSGSAWQLQAELQWTHSQGTQPLRGYEVRVGNIYAEAPVRTTVDALGYIYQTSAAGTYMHWVTAIDVAGNRSAPGYLQLTTTPTIEDALAELQDGFDDAVQDILNANQNVSALAGHVDDVTASLNAQIATINSQLSDIGGTPEWDAGETYGDGVLVKFDGGLYRSLQAGNTGKNPGSFPTWWSKIGDYDSVGEAVSALAAQTASNTNRIEIAEGAITSQSDAQTALFNQVNHTTNGLPGKASAAALTTLTNRVTSAEGVNSTQGTAITSLQNAINDPATGLGAKASASALSALTNRVTSAEGALTSQGDAITSVSGSVTTANNNAAAAQAAAESAATLAGSKGKVIVQSAAPAAADRLTQNLWIDITGNANTPKRWNGTAWVAVTDKVASDAAAAAASAQTTANSKADASALTALSQTVSNQGGALTAQAGRLDQVEAGISSVADGLVIDPELVHGLASWADTITGLAVFSSSDAGVPANAPAAKLVRSDPSASRRHSRKLRGGIVDGSVAIVTPGEVIDASVWVYLEGPVNGTGSTGLRVLYGSTTNPNTSVAASSTYLGVAGVWTLLRVSFTIPSGATRIRVSVVRTSAVETGYAWFAGLQAERRSASASNVNAAVVATSEALANQIGAEATARQTLAANISGSSGENLILNPGFDPAGYRLTQASAISTTSYLAGTDAAVPANAPSSVVMVREKLSTDATRSSVILRLANNTTRFPVREGDTIDLSAWMAMTGGTANNARIFLVARDSATVAVGPTFFALILAATSGWQKLVAAPYVVPAGAETVELGVSLEANAPQGMKMFVGDLDMRKRASTGMALAASVTTTQQALATLDGKVAASYTLNVTAGSSVAGIRIGTDGAVSSFVVLSDKFAWALPNGTGVKYPLVLGAIAGVASFGFSGNMFVDGMFTARMIGADEIRAIHIRTDEIEGRHVKAGTITADKLAIGLSGNKLKNSELITTAGWTLQNGGGLNLPNCGINLPNADWYPRGSNTIGIYQDAAGAGNSYWWMDIAVEPGVRLEIQSCMATHRCEGYMLVDFYNTALTEHKGNVITPVSPPNTGGGNTLSAFPKRFAFGIVPPGAYIARVILLKRPTVAGQTDSWAWFTQPQVNIASPHQTIASDYTPSGIGTLITAAGISTTSLSSINPNLGLVVYGKLQSADGMMTVDLDSKSIHMLKAGRRAQISPSGLYLGADNGIGNRLEYNLDTGRLWLAGEFTADSINAVNTANIAGQAVTTLGTVSTPLTNYEANAWRAMAYLYPNMPSGGTGVITFVSVQGAAGATDIGVDFRVRNLSTGQTVRQWAALRNGPSGAGGGYSTDLAVVDASPAVGVNTYVLESYRGGTFWSAQTSMTQLVARR